MDVEAFLTENKEKYEIIMHLQDLLNHISKETFQETIKYVEEKSDFFFKNRESAILFLWNFKIFTIYNFTQLEIILDVLLHFSTKLHEVNITDIDVITMMNNMICDIYYLYSKNFISIKHIIQKSVQDSVFFVYFYPEIDEYDHEYAEKRKNSIFEGSDEHRIEEFLNTILSDINQHKQNREKAFNPSLLHKAIRDDDINNFQSILSQNNYSINYHFDYSFYERTLTENNTPSLIQVAAVYGSLQIFKFLLMQPNIEFDDKLICYAISGRNYEIIHLCEGKCSPKLALQFSINSHQHELTNYFIDNFDEKDIIQNPDSNKDDCDDNSYNMMNNELLSVALRNANYQILLPCLKKVTHKMDNFDKETGNCKSDVFLRVANHDFDLFKFLYSHKKEKMKFHVNYMIQLRMFDAFKYLLKDQNLYNFVGLFDFSLRNNYYFIFIIIDFLIDTGVVKNGIIYNEKIKKYLSDSLLIDSCCCYDEDLIEKISSVIEIDNPIDFIDALIEYTSTKFINSLFKRKLRFSPDSNEMHELLLDENLDEAAESLQSLSK